MYGREWPVVKADAEIKLTLVASDRAGLGVNVKHDVTIIPENSVL